MKLINTSIVAAILVFSTAVNADEYDYESAQHYADDENRYYVDYARVLKAKPIYRQVRRSVPIEECWQEPVYHTGHSHGSAGGLLAGGIIGSVIGHQFGEGKSRRIATAVGTLVGAKIGHDAVNRHNGHTSTSVVGYEEHCQTSHQVSYEKIIDGYDVTYKFHGKRYQTFMPYHPGKRIKMRVQFTPMI